MKAHGYDDGSEKYRERDKVAPACEWEKWKKV